MQSKHSKTLPNLCSTEPIHLHVLSLSLRVRTVILQGILTSHSNRVHMQPKWVSESRTVSQQRARQKRSGQVRPWESYNMSGLLCIGLLVFFFSCSLLCCRMTDLQMISILDYNKKLWQVFLSYMACPCTVFDVFYPQLSLTYQM